MNSYVAIVHKDVDSEFGVSFPDFPGCVSAGTTLVEATAMAAEALNGHVELMIEHGETIPEPSTLDAIMRNPDNMGGVPITVALTSSLPSRAVSTVPQDVVGSQGRCLDRRRR